MPRRRLTLVKPGKSSTRAESLVWLQATRMTLKSLLLRALQEGDIKTAEQLSLCRDHLARLAVELVDPGENDGEARK